QTDLSPMYFSEDALKFYDAINFMKGAIVFSDKVTTVSKTYADEIKYSFFGEGLDGVIRQYHYKISGITNGIDTTIWDPQTDPYLFKNYSLKNIKDKSVNKKALQRMYGLEEKDVPVFAMVTRLVENKGLELVRYIMDEFLTTEDVQVIILGTGEYSYEEMFKYYEWKFPDKLKANIYYNNEESHKIYAGADFLMMPSVFEPCGISQLIAMRYGTIPVVRETGGLRDTVQSFNEFTKEGNGFSFTNINAHDFLYTLRRAISFYYNDDFKVIQEHAMNSKNDWEQSAKEYIKLYEELIK
ncbi:MAG: glycogen/starch synthase, partial [Finegoldia magna]|nr:glycogen/starch synthase [Finegoldia magna]